jgi:hypothetical protein
MFSSLSPSYSVPASLFLRCGVYKQGTLNLLQDIRVNKYGGLLPFCDLISQQAGVPVMAAEGGTGGTAMIFGWESTSSSVFLNFLTVLAEIGGDCEGINFFQGEQDTAAAVTTVARYSTGMIAMIDNLRNAVGRSATNLPFFSAILGRKNTASSPIDAWWDVRVAQVNTLAAVQNCFHLGGYYDLSKSDDLHLDAAGFLKMGARIAQAIGHYLGLGGFTNNMIGALPTGATFSGNNITITYNLNGATTLRGKTGASGLTAFTVRNSSGTVQTISSTNIPTANTVTLTMAVAPTAGWTIGYANNATFDAANMLYTDKAVTGIVTNDTVPALPNTSILTL